MIRFARIGERPRDLQDRRSRVTPYLRYHPDTWGFSSPGDTSLPPPAGLAPAAADLQRQVVMR